jgi:uncharacterized membrane protein SpoIIM required for sporulation
MKQDVFIHRYRSEWMLFERWLDLRAQSKKDSPTQTLPFDDLEFPHRYRRLCQHLAIARRRAYSPQIIEQLSQLTERGHQVMYKAPALRWRRAAFFLGAEFPHLVRSQAWYMWASAFLLFVPMIVAFVLLQYRPEFIYSIMDAMQVAEVESMYNPAAEHQKLGRSEGSDLMMFGFYIWNNVSIAFRTFAFGVLGCVGAIWVLIFNGISIGGVAGHLQQMGFGDPFWRFVSGHSAPELLAIVIAGGAGLRIGMSLLAPGRLTLRESLMEAGKIGARLCLGAFVMLVFAAFIEAFWSSIAWMPRTVKFSFGISMWVIILLWLSFGGRVLQGEEHAP